MVFYKRDSNVIEVQQSSKYILNYYHTYYTILLNILVSLTNGPDSHTYQKRYT